MVNAKQTQGNLPQGIEMASFDGREIPGPLVDGKRHVVLKPLVEGIGLNWDNQLGLIKNNEVLKSVIAVAATTGADGKTYEMVCLPEEYLQGWLFSIPANRYKGEKREKLLRYQRECCEVLHSYWTKGFSINPRIDAGQLLELRRQLNEVELKLKLAETEKKAILLESQFKDAEISALKREEEIFGNRTAYGSINKDGKPRTNPRRATLTAAKRKLGKAFSAALEQLFLPMLDN